MTIKTPKIQLEGNIEKILGTQIAKPLTMRIGNPITKAIYVDETDKLGLIYAHPLGDNPSHTATVVNDLRATNLVYADLIKVKRENDGYYHLIAFSPESGEYLDGVNTSDQTPVYRSQIIDGGLLPNDNATVLYKGTTYIDDSDNSVSVTTDQNTGNLIDGSTDDTSATAISPPSTANKSIYVLVQVDPATDTLSYKQSSEFASTFTYIQASQSGFLPSPDTDRKIAGYVRLSKGQTAIKREHIVSLPDIYRYGSSGGSVSQLSDLSDVADSTATNRFALLADGTDFHSRAITEADISDLGTYLESVDLTSDVTNTLPIANGGTNATTASGARTNLDVQQTLSGLSISSATVATSDKVLIQDVSDSDNLKTVTAQSIADLASSGSSDLPYLLASHLPISDADVPLANRIPSGYTETIYGGTASASSTGGGDVAANAFDNDTATSWQATSGTTSATLTYDYGVSVTETAVKYGIIPRTGDLDRAPSDWTFEGSNDNSNWTVLDTQSGITGWATATAKEYEFLNSTAYRYYRLNMTATAGPRLAISELKIYEASGYTDNNDKLNQSFQLEVENICKRVELQLAKVGSPTGNLTLELRETSATGTLLATSATVAESSLTTAYSAIEFEFSSPPTLSASTTYWAVLSTNRTASEVNYVTWAGETSETYADGKMQSENSSTWSDESKDALFQVFGEGEQTFWQATTSTATYTTTSTSPVEISDMTHTITTNGRPVVIELRSGAVGSTGTADTLHSVGVNIDGSYHDVVLARSTNINTDNDYPATFSYTTVPTAGSHTFTLAYKMVYGSNTVLSFMNSAIFSVRLT